MPHDGSVLRAATDSQCSHFGMADWCVLSLCCNGFALQMLWYNNLMLGWGRGGFTLWYEYLSSCVMLHDGSVLQAATDSQCSSFGMVLDDVYCLFAAPDSHFRCFSAMTSCLVGVLWGGFTLLCDYVS
jgi:hypothetical protein